MITHWHWQHSANTEPLPRTKGKRYIPNSDQYRFCELSNESSHQSFCKALPDLDSNQIYSIRRSRHRIANCQCELTSDLMKLFKSNKIVSQFHHSIAGSRVYSVEFFFEMFKCVWCTAHTRQQLRRIRSQELVVCWVHCAMNLLWFFDRRKASCSLTAGYCDVQHACDSNWRRRVHTIRITATTRTNWILSQVFIRTQRDMKPNTIAYRHACHGNKISKLHFSHFRCVDNKTEEKVRTLWEQSVRPKRKKWKEKTFLFFLRFLHETIGAYRVLYGFYVCNLCVRAGCII